MNKYILAASYAKGERKNNKSFLAASPQLIVMETSAGESIKIILFKRGVAISGLIDPYKRFTIYSRTKLDILPPPISKM